MRGHASLWVLIACAAYGGQVDPDAAAPEGGAGDDAAFRPDGEVDDATVDASAEGATVDAREDDAARPLGDANGADAGDCGPFPGCTSPLTCPSQDGCNRCTCTREGWTCGHEPCADAEAEAGACPVRPRSGDPCEENGQRCGVGCTPSCRCLSHQWVCGPAPPCESAERFVSRRLSAAWAKSRGHRERGEARDCSMGHGLGTLARRCSGARPPRRRW